MLIGTARNGKFCGPIYIRNPVRQNFFLEMSIYDTSNRQSVTLHIVDSSVPLEAEATHYLRPPSLASFNLAGIGFTIDSVALADNVLH